MAARAAPTAALLVRDQRGRSALDIACRLGNVRSCHALWKAACELEAIARGNQLSGGNRASSREQSPQQALAGSMAASPRAASSGGGSGFGATNGTATSAAEAAGMTLGAIIALRFPPIPPRLPQPARAHPAGGAGAVRDSTPGSGSSSPAVQREARQAWDSQHARLVLSSDNNGVTPTHHCCLTAQPESLRWCVSAASMPISPIARGGATPFMLLCQAPAPGKPAISCRCPEVMRWMLSPAGGGVPHADRSSDRQHRSDVPRQGSGSGSPFPGVDGADAQGATPLHMACASAARALGALASASAKSPAARVAETAAASASALVLLLLRAGASTEIADARGNTPRGLAEAGPRLPAAARLRLGDSASAIGSAEDVLASILRNRGSDPDQDSGDGSASGRLGDSTLEGDGRGDAGNTGGTPALLDDGGSRDGASVAGGSTTSARVALDAAAGVPGPVELMRQVKLPPAAP